MVAPRRGLLIAVPAVVLLGLGGFGLTRLTADSHDEPPQPRVVQPGAPGQSGRTLSPQELARLSAPPHTPADTLFFQRMIRHHAQALEMTALVRGRAHSADLTLLAERIDVAQRDEITLMRDWLSARGEPLPEAHSGHGGHGEPMPGMLSDDELARLAAARGVAFDRLFLELMIRHHEGALLMVQQLYATGGGTEVDSDRFAQHVRVDQSIEIRRMRDMLGKLG